MAEIASLSLAANIFQIIEYGVKFVDMAWKIYGSRSNALDGFRNVQKLSTDLEAVTQRLENHDRESSINDQGLKDIINECRVTNQEILASLSEIGLLPHQKRSKRGELRTAFKLRWNEDNIRALARQLEACRSQLILALVASLR